LRPRDSRRSTRRHGRSQIHHLVRRPSRTPFRFFLADKHIAPAQIQHVLVTLKLDDTERRKYSLTAAEFIPSRILSRDISATGKVRYKIRFRDGHVAMVGHQRLDHHLELIEEFEHREMEREENGVVGKRISGGR